MKQSGARRVFGFLICCAAWAVPAVAAGPSVPATTAFNGYIARLEGRLTAQHRPENPTLASGAEALGRARLGEAALEKVATKAGAEVPGAMLHHWRGVAFAPGATAAGFVRLMQDFDGYPGHYAPQVVRARLLGRQGDRFQASMRVRQKHILTVVMDTSYEVLFGRIDARRGYSLSRSTEIAEIDAPGTARERALDAGQEHGFLWRLNTYWSYEERDGGLYLEIESVTLTRSIPTGLAWAIQPFIESVPRESLEFTLRSTREALRPSSSPTEKERLP